MKNTSLKSVKDIANELNTTPQTIYKYVNRLEGKYVKKISNVIHITPEGVDRVKNEYLYNNPLEDKKGPETEINREVYDLLADQIKIKDKQIEALLKTNESLNERIREINHLIALERKEKALQGNIEPLISEHKETNNSLGKTETEKVEKGGILERIRRLFTGSKTDE